MRVLKRISLLALEITVLLVGTVLTVAIAAFLVDPRFEFLALVTGLVVTAVSLIVVRRKTRRFKIEYDAANWMASRSYRKLHPTQARYLHLLRRCLIWFPTLCAVFVLFFFPVASHIVHPRSRFLRHYRVPIPWNFMVFSSSPGLPEEYSVVNALASSSGKGRFGITPFWDQEYVPSLMVFGSVGPNGSFETNHLASESRRNGAAQLSKRIFQLRRADLTCWQYLSPQSRAARFWLGHSYDDRPLWEIACETQVDVHDRDFYALFYGRWEDIPAFYNVLQNLTSTD
jgi:hypothetical protein